MNSRITQPLAALVAVGLIAGCAGRAPAKREAAEAILDYRAERGRFSSEEELREVPGMDLAWFEEMEGMLGVGGKAVG